MFGISAGEFIVLVAVAAVVLGPERLPDYARQLARLIRELRTMAQGAGEKVREEMGPEFDEIDWRKLDPRQYDPRRIVREALSDAFDPDDPLGLKDDYDGLKKDLSLRKTEKPVSRGGPAEATAAARTRSAERAAADRGKAEGGETEERAVAVQGTNLTKPAKSAPPADDPAPAPAPAFDPDAT